MEIKKDIVQQLRWYGHAMWIQDNKLVKLWNEPTWERKKRQTKHQMERRS
jgi:hypothetical protein